MVRFSGFLLLIAVAATAHMVPIYPNHLYMHVDGQRLIVEARVSAPFWKLDIFGGTPAASHWNADLREKTRTYWDKHVVLSVDGQPLLSQLEDARYTEEFWQKSGEEQLLLTFHYPLPADARQLAGRLTLYEEDLRYSSQAVHGEWVSYVYAQGSKPATLTVPIEQPDFTIAIADLIRTPTQQQKVLFINGLTFWQSTPAFLLLTSGILLIIASRKGIRTSAMTVFPTAMAGGGAVGSVSHFHVATMAGAFLICALAGVLLMGGLHLYRQRLMKHSQSRTSVLFRTQTHFLGLAAAGFGVYLLLKGLYP